MKRWMYFLAIGAALVLIGVLAVKLYFTEDRLRALIVPGIEAATNRKAELGGVSLSLFPSVGIRVDNFRLSNPDGGQFPNPWFLSLKSLFIDVRLVPLLAKRVEVDKLVLDEPVIHLDVTADGRKNYSSGGAAGAASRSAGGTPAGALGAFLVSGMEISNGRIESYNRKLDSRWTIEGLDQTLRVESAPDGNALTLAGTSGVGKFSYGTGSSWYIEGIPLTASEQISYSIADDRLDLTGVDVKLKDVPLKISGSVRDLRQDALVLDIAVSSPELTVEHLLSLLPAGAMKGAADVAASGNVSFSMNVTGESADDRNPGVKAAFRLSGGTVRYRSLTGSITGIAVDGVLDIPPAPVGKKDIGTFEVKQFTATLGANSLAGKLRVTGFGDPALTATLAGKIALDELGRYYPLGPGTTLSGTLASDVSIEGKPADPGSIRASGTLKFRNVSYSTPSMTRPVRDLNGDASFNNQLLELKGVALAIGGSDLRLDASLRNYLSLAFASGEKAAARPFLNFTLKSKVLNTADISSTPDTAAAARAGAPAKGAAKGGLLLPGIDMAGTVDVETLKTEKFTFTNAKGGISMTDGVAKLKGMQLDAFGGTIGTDGTLDLSRPDTRPFDLKLDVKGVESNSMLSPFTTFGQYLFGTLSLSTALKGDLDDTLGISPATLTGNGSAIVENGKLTGVPLLQKLSGFLSADNLREVDFKNWTQSFSVADGKLNVKDLKIGGKDADLTVNGVQGLDGSMEYSMHVVLPQSVSDRVKLQGVGDQLLRFFKDRDGRLNLDFLVSGRTQSPVLKLDTRAQENMLKQQLQDEASKKLADPLKKAADALKKLIKPKP
jgi:uncharacterized protein involved in outer membrane biogenesis